MGFNSAFKGLNVALTRRTNVSESNAVSEIGEHWVEEILNCKKFNG